MLPVTEPVEWLVVFHRKSTRWVERLTPGRYKHVSLAAFVLEAGSWVHLSWDLGRLRVSVIADEHFNVWLSSIANDAGIMRMPAPAFDIGPWRPRLGLSCTAMACHVLGLRRSALLPDSLWRLLAREGAEIVTHGQSPPETEDRDAGADAAGPGGAGHGQPRTA